MEIVFEKDKLDIEDILSEHFHEKDFMDHEIGVIELVKKWKSKDDHLIFKTSGSTSAPKVVKLTKQQMRKSAEFTMGFIDPKRELKKCILCISPEYIGGAMLMIRALIYNLDLIVLKPTSIPKIDHTKSLVSMVPLQVMNALDDDESALDNVHTLLIGGANLPRNYQDLLSQRNVNAYATYGMTETASNVALRHVASGNSHFKIIGDSAISTDQRGCLKIKGTVTNHEWIQTNDAVKLLDDKTFIWIGRADFVINSGGYKINPESIEEELRSQIDHPILIVPKNDKSLGQKVVMLIESKEPIKIPDNIYFNIHPFAKPKIIQFVNDFIYTENGKIDRLKTIAKYIT